MAIAITVIMEGKSARAFEALSKLNEDILVKIIRGDLPQLLHQKEVVLGDIIVLESGDKIAVDGRVVESSALSVDESVLTGESMAVKKMRMSYLIATARRLPSGSI